MHTDLLYQDDAYLREFEATVLALEGDRVALDRTAFYATGEGQPHDEGTIAGARVTDVTKDGGLVWHRFEGAVPGVGKRVSGSIDWSRR
jgi:misacylated tRNA(Ala) deacylase